MLLLTVRRESMLGEQVVEELGGRFEAGDQEMIVSTGARAIHAKHLDAA